MAPIFSDEAIWGYDPTVSHHLDILVQKIRQVVVSNQSAIVNALERFEYLPSRSIGVLLCRAIFSIVSEERDKPMNGRDPLIQSRDYHFLRKTLP